MSHGDTVELDQLPGLVLRAATLLGLSRERGLAPRRPACPIRGSVRLSTTRLGHFARAARRYSPIPVLQLRENLTVLKLISGRLGLHGDSTLTTFVLPVIPRSPRGWEIAQIMFVGVSQKVVDGSEAAIRREAASGTQEEYNLLSIFWPLKQYLKVGTGFSAIGRPSSSGQTFRHPLSTHKHQTSLCSLEGSRIKSRGRFAHHSPENSLPSCLSLFLLSFVYW